MLCRNPVLKSNITEDSADCYWHLGLFLPSKNSCENSGTPEPATSLVIPHFPHPPNFRGHNSEKCGTGPELFNVFRRELMRANIAMLRRPKAGWDVVWDAAGTGQGKFQHPPREASGIKRNSTEQYFIQRSPEFFDCMKRLLKNYRNENCNEKVTTVYVERQLHGPSLICLIIHMFLLLN